MPLYIDQKYVGLISPKLTLFKQKKSYLWNFRCPLCGDSKKSSSKTRAYFYRKKENIFFICHNCNVSLSLRNFLKTMDRVLYNEYSLENMTQHKPKQHSTILPENIGTLPVFGKKIFLPKVQNLAKSHAARVYIEERQIPESTELYFAENFKEFVEKLLPTHDPVRFDDSRIIIPFRNEAGILQGFQGRSLEKNSKVKYITVKVDESAKKIYGLDRVDFSKPVYVVEGPIDSMFISNSLATMDSALYRVVETLGQHDYVFVYDNEPRNKNIIDMMRKTISKNLKICIWPSSLHEKDINDMVLAGHNPLEIIKRNIYSNRLKAEIQFNLWRKV